MWSKLVRLNALACTTSAYDKLLGEIRSTPPLRADLVGAIEEACAVGRAEGALDVEPARALDELERAHETLGSSMQRDIAAGRPPELDAIPGSVLRAAARHGLRCPTIERLVVADRARAPASSRRGSRARAPDARPPRRGAGRRRGERSRVKGSSGAGTPGRSPGAPRGDRLDRLLLGLAQLVLVVLAVAEHAEVAGDAAVGVDRDAREHLLALLEAEALEVEVREADPVGGVRGVLAVVRSHRLREALEVLGDLARCPPSLEEEARLHRRSRATPVAAPRRRCHRLGSRDLTRGSNGLPDHAFLARRDRRAVQGDGGRRAPSRRPARGAASTTPRGPPTAAS